MNRLLSVLIAGVFAAGFPTAALATCEVVGKIVSVTMLDDKQKKSKHVIYLRERATDEFFYSVQTRDDDLAEAAILMAALQTRAKIKASTSACPVIDPDLDVGEHPLGKVISLTAVP